MCDVFSILSFSVPKKSVSSLTAPDKMSDFWGIMYNCGVVLQDMGVYMGILICIENGIKKVDIYGDSKLVVEQLNGNWRVKNDNIKVVYDPLPDGKIVLTDIGRIQP